MYANNAKTPNDENYGCDENCGFYVQITYMYHPNSNEAAF